MEKFKINLFGEEIEISRNENGKFVFPYEHLEPYKTALKPAHEPIVMAQKPLEKGLTYAQNILKWGVGALNIDESRIEYNDGTTPEEISKKYSGNNQNNVSVTNNFGVKIPKNTSGDSTFKGRFPANIIHDGSDEVINSFPNTKKGGAIHKDYKINNNIYGDMSMLTSNHTDGFGDSGSASRFFYGAKAQKKDRDQGLDEFEEKNPYPNNFNGLIDKSGNQVAENVTRKNIHPTVKPTDLMRYLVRMVTPKNGTVADIFMGSGSTGKAVMVENILNDKNYKFIGFELTKEYLPIARDRIIKGSIEFANEEKYGKIKEGKVNEKQLKLF